MYLQSLKAQIVVLSLCGILSWGKKTQAIGSSLYSVMYKCKINQQFVNTLKKMTIVQNFFWGEGGGGGKLFRHMAKHAKQKSPTFADPSRAYASTEQSAVRGMYVDPNRQCLH